jgi:FlaA1/EpsC-like NDP-sugar epimerase
MYRYFMTIPEAVQLVLQAAALGTDGETFVLDMGEPVRILDLARDLIQLSGLEVDRDVTIAFSGLRPGEKLNEELFTSGEDVERTRHEKIYRVRNGGAVGRPTRVDDLIVAAEAGDGLRLRHLLAEIVPGYPHGPKVAERTESSFAMRRSGGARDSR